MKKKVLLLYILAFSMMFAFSGCRSRVAETESESETISETEKQTEKKTEKKTQKQSETQKSTEKKTSTQSGTKKNTSSTDKTTVKPSTVNGSSKTQTSESQAKTNQTDASAGTQMCPYCYQQISLASDGEGSTIYADHVTQEKAWADYMASSNTQTTPSTEAPSSSSDSAQCPYCGQWFSISDGSYNSHISAETSGTSDYITCPLCGNTYQKGVEYDTHYCTGINHE